MLWHRKDGGSLDMRCEFPTSGRKYKQTKIFDEQWWILFLSLQLMHLILQLGIIVYYRSREVLEWRTLY